MVSHTNLVKLIHLLKSNDQAEMTHPNKKLWPSKDETPYPKFTKTLLSIFLYNIAYVGTSVSIIDSTPVAHEHENTT